MLPSRELAEKLDRIEAFLDRESLNAVLLSTQRNFSWLTCGGTNHVGTSTPDGVASLLVLRQGPRFVISSNNERDRISDEETGALGFESVAIPWHELRQDPMMSLRRTLAQIVDPATVGADSAAGFTNVEGRFSKLRYRMTHAEVERYRQHGLAVAEAVEETARSLQPGMSEREIEALLSFRIMQRGARPTVLLVGSDERFRKYRHPIPTDRTVERFVALSTCARRWGMTVAVTRLVHFGAIPDDVISRYLALQRVEAKLLAATSPGRSSAEIFAILQNAYRDAGYPDEWKAHHQGGATGYLEREWVATPNGDHVVEEHQPFSWNPTIQGTKIEDTVLTSADAIEVLTHTGAWPSKVLEVAGQLIERPQILVME
jgi:Xaa-Pro aminopeptidase